MTTLEFICAQALRTLQGLLIGFWYSMFSIQYTLMSTLDHIFIYPLDMLIHQVVRTGLVLFYLMLYLHVSRAYQYRVRDWIVNVQWMIEDVFYRTMDQEERYTGQQMVEEQAFPFHPSSTAITDYGTFHTSQD